MTKKNKKAGKKHPLDDRFYLRALGRVYTQWELTDIVIRETLAPLAHETVDLDVVSGLWLRFVEDHIGLLGVIHERWLANSKTPIRQRDLYPFSYEFEKFLKPEQTAARYVASALETLSHSKDFGDVAFMEALLTLDALLLLEGVPVDEVPVNTVRQIIYSSAGCTVKLSDHVFYALARNPDVDYVDILNRDDNRRLIPGVGWSVLHDLLFLSTSSTPETFLELFDVKASFERVDKVMVIKVEIVSKDSRNLHFCGTFKATKPQHDIWVAEAWSLRSSATGAFIWAGDTAYQGGGASTSHKVGSSISEYFFKYIFNFRANTKSGSLQAIQHWLDFAHLTTKPQDSDMASVWNANTGSIHVMPPSLVLGNGAYTTSDRADVD